MEEISDWTREDNDPDNGTQEDEDNDLYESDKPGDPGFDCDDYASALGNSINKQIAADPNLAGAGVRVTQVALEWKVQDDSPDAGPKDTETVRHAILKITVCGKNFFIDPMVGAGSGEPTDEGGDLTDDIDDVIGDAWEMIDGSLFVDFEYKLNDRHGTEPPPFSEDQEEVKRFETIIENYNAATKNNLDSGDFQP